MATVSSYSMNRSIKPTKPVMNPSNPNLIKLIRFLIITSLIAFLVSCFALVKAFASDHVEQNTMTNVSLPTQSVTHSATKQTVSMNQTVQVKPSVIVEKGDTLWSIAQEHAGKTDIRSYINKLMKLNGLSKPMLQEGQQLLLP